MNHFDRLQLTLAGSASFLPPVPWSCRVDLRFVARSRVKGRNGGVTQIQAYVHGGEHRRRHRLADANWGRCRAAVVFIDVPPEALAARLNKDSGAGTTNDEVSGPVLGGVPPEKLRALLERLSKYEQADVGFASTARSPRRLRGSDHDGHCRLHRQQPTEMETVEGEGKPAAEVE